MKHKGIVLKLTKSKAIISTNDFQCYYIKRSPTIYVGKEVEFTNKDIVTKKSVLIKPALSVACFILLIACVLSLSKIINNISPKVFAYISVDINPSFEIEIDDMGNVLNLLPLNDDAKVIADKLEIDKINVSNAIDIIINEAIKSNVINENEKDFILVSSTLNIKKEENSQQYQSEKEKLDIIINSLKDSIEKSGKADVYIVQADVNEREAARSKGISTGRYVLYNKYKDLENDLSLEDAKDADVNVLIKSMLDVASEERNPEESPKMTPTPTPTHTATHTPTDAPTPKPANTPTSTPAAKPSPKTASNSASTSTPAPKPTSTPTPTLMPTPTPTPTPADKIAYGQFMKFESSNYRGYYIRVKSFSGRIDPYVNPVEDSMFKIVPGLADPSCISFESKTYPGYYLKHENFRVILKKYEDTDLFREDATFRVVPGWADENMISFQSYNYPYRYIRHKDFELYIENIKTDLDRKDATFIGIKVD
ncbi:AbfB domain-containing protein [Acetivibrio thermocellus]|uniref:AbfB domain-containing protein n=1 Tax=Acetivibrio thermocellus TaxID=1515 RepID=UPI0010A5F49B|nr:AbfB domain-containing protein [Acetivibrio thermocellus]THJ78985.1 anti-sigma factor domain-containing protein [Acetivibrio thermocellus]